MPPLNPFPIARTLAFRPHLSRRTGNAFVGARYTAVPRTYSDGAKATNDPSTLPKAKGEAAVGPNMQQQEHVSEEASKMAKIMGNEGPDIEGQGTPVQEVLENDPKAMENAPQVLKDETSPASGKRSFSTLARRMQPELTGLPPTPELDVSMLPTASQRADYASTSLPSLQQGPGHNFPLPELPLPPRLMRKFRDEPIVTQLTKLLMRDGKLARAQRNMSHILTVLRTNPAPTYSATRLLLPGAPPASHLPLDPVLYLTLAIDSVAPLLRIRSQRGAAGGGVALQIPAPLGLRQRRRTAFSWILDAAEKRKSRGSGRLMFPTKVAEELVAIIEGRSAIWQRRDAVHKLGTSARSNLNFSLRGRR